MLAFDRPDPRYRYTDRWGAYAFVLEPGRGLFLVETPDGWELPGGGIEAGESPVQALEREIWEETGHRLRTARPFVTVRQIWTRPDKGTFFNKICTVFLASVEGPLQAPLEADHRPFWTDPAATRGRMAETYKAWVIERALEVQRV